MKKILARTLAFAFAATVCTGALAQTRKPNILVIWGDDIGRDNISAYSMGIMGYRTPNIDRIAKEGAIFTDSYAQQSCTAGRASFILGQHPFRTGLLTIGMPGSPLGIPTGRPRSPTCSRARATPPASSAKITWATAIRTCQPSTASTSSWATSTTSTQRKSPRRTTTRRTPSSGRSTARAACCIPGRTARVARKSRTPVRSIAHGCRRSISRSTTPRTNSWTPR